MWFTLYFSRILLFYAVQLKSRIYFLPVFDMKKKKKRSHCAFQLWTFRKVVYFRESDWQGDK